MRILTLILGLALSLLASVGQIAGLSGQVQIDRAGKTLKAEIGTQLAKGDRIRTAASARAQLVFNDDTVITLGNGSEFAVEEFDYASAQPKASFSAVKGAFKVMTGQISKAAPQSFELKSRTATIGIRGTHFLGVIGADGDTVACTDGRIIVGSRDLGSPVNVAAGQLTQVMPGQAPTPPRAYTAAELQKLSASAGGESSANGQMQPEETKGEEGGAKQPIVSLGDIVRDIAPLGKQSWVFYDAWFYYSQSAFNEEWSYFGYPVTHTKFVSPNQYVEWGKSSLTIDTSDMFQFDELGIENYPSSITFTEYWVYPAQGYSVTSAMPTAGSRSFSGKLAGGVFAFTESGIRDRGEIITSSSRITMNVNFGSTSHSLTGNMNFTTTGGSSWNVNFASNNFSGNTFDATPTSGVTWGGVYGTFIGDNAAAVAGDFYLVKEGGSGGEYAAGVFAAQ